MSVSAAVATSPSVLAIVQDLPNKFSGIAHKYAEVNGMVYISTDAAGTAWRICTKERFEKIKAQDPLEKKHFLSVTQPTSRVPFIQVKPPKRQEVQEVVVNPAVEAAIAMEGKEN